MRAGQPGATSRLGDITMGTSTGTISEVGAEDQDTPSAHDLHVECSSRNLPPNSTQRIRSFPANTLPHIPSSCRLRMIAAVAQCWQGMVLGSNEYWMLEERLKLLAPMPPGLGAAAQVAKRSRFGRSTASRTNFGEPRNTS